MPRPRSSAAAIAALLVACALASPSSAPEQTPPVRPAMPVGWQTATSNEGDVQLALPPDFDALLTTPGVLAQATAAGVGPALEVWATAPDAVPQPGGGASVRAWLEQLQWLPATGEGGVTDVSGATEREVLLPAGRALEIAMTADPGTEAESRVVVYAIATEQGYATIRFTGLPAFMEQRAVDLLLITFLVKFEAAADDG